MINIEKERRKWKKVLALTEDGRLTYCTAPEDKRGKGRCNHVSHQKEGQSVQNFIEEIKDSQDSTLNDINKEDLEAVKKSGWALRHVKNQTPEICMEAVKQNGWALKFVQDQTPEICMAAVKQNGLALKYVKNQSPEICMAAVKQNGQALEYIQDQTPEIIQTALEQDPDAIEFVKI